MGKPEAGGGDIRPYVRCEIDGPLLSALIEANKVSLTGDPRDFSDAARDAVAYQIQPFLDAFWDYCREQQVDLKAPGTFKVIITFEPEE